MDIYWYFRWLFFCKRIFWKIREGNEGETLLKYFYKFLRRMMYNLFVHLDIREDTKIPSGHCDFSISWTFLWSYSTICQLLPYKEILKYFSVCWVGMKMDFLPWLQIIQRILLFFNTFQNGQGMAFHLKWGKFYFFAWESKRNLYHLKFLAWEEKGCFVKCEKWPSWELSERQTLSIRIKGSFSATFASIPRERGPKEQPPNFKFIPTIVWEMRIFIVIS